jgi:transcriptional regulator with XRE-family HTH domain
MMGTMTERSELAAFLRAKREQIRPADVGLPDHGRRRTPGLRREEVATLAGVSVDYLVRLEQGRDVHPSAEVLAALAAALRLTDDERVHLKKLGLISANRALCPAAQALVHDVAPTVLALLDGLGSTPAFVLGPASDVLASNPAWKQLVRPLGMLDHEAVNLARYTFLDARARAVYADWAVAADEQASRLRSASVRWGHDGGFTALVDELRAEPEFAQRWSAHPVSEQRRGEKRLVHPDLGELRIAYEVLLLPDDTEQQLVTWLPADDATAAALRATVPASPPQLRVVGGG